MDAAGGTYNDAISALQDEYDNKSYWVNQGNADNSIATVNSTTGEVTFVNVGTVTISANILSTLNYNSATSLRHRVMNKRVAPVAKMYF